MTSLIKNQVLKHLTKFFKDLAPEQLQLSALKGSCELSNLQLEEKVLMELLSFPAWIRINRAVCDQLSIRIPWTKIKSVPIQMNLNEVTVEVEVCEEFRDNNTDGEDEVNLSSFISAQAPPGKYGFVDRVIDGITVTVNNVLITFKSKLMSATFNLSRVVLESRCPNWKAGDLSLTRIKDQKRGQILLFKIVDWQTMRLEAKCLTDPDQAPLRLITNHAQCRLTIKKNLDDCSVVAARIFVIFEDILWVLTFAQFTSAASFVEYVFSLIKRSPMSKKTGLLDDQAGLSSATVPSSTPTPFAGPQSAPFISPLNTPVHTSQADKVSILSGNLSSSSLLEQKFLCYDILETSLHLYIDKVDAHLYDDIETKPNSKSNRDSGGALQTTLDQIQVDCYPYSRAISDRKHWYRWFDPSPNTRKQWLRSHFAEFDSARLRKSKIEEQTAQNEELDEPSRRENLLHPPVNKFTPTANDDQLLSLTVLVKIKDYCMNCVATRHSMRGAGLNKFIQTDKDYQMPAEMPSLYLELNYFYYFDAINRMMVYDNVPDPLAYMHLSPTKLLFDSPTLVFLNSFHVNLSKAFVHLNDLFPEDTTAPKIQCRVEILMPQIILPAKSTADQPTLANMTSSLLVKSGKITLSSSLYDKEIISKLLNSIDKLKENPSQPINMGSNYHPNQIKKDNTCKGDWTKVWNASLVNGMGEFSVQNQLWTIQFEPVWMDFMNYDVDELSSGERLEPIVEPVNAYAFIHLDLSSTSHNNKQSEMSNVTRDNGGDSTKNTMTKKRDVISILVSVIDGSILANMDKVQFGFLQRLGMHVEKLIQQVKEDASSIIQLDTVVEDTLEINLTAYIKDIKARLILDKKVDMQRLTLNDSYSSNYDRQDLPFLSQQTKEHQERSTLLIDQSSSVASEMPEVQSVNNQYFSNLAPTLTNPFDSNKPTVVDRGYSSFAYAPEESSLAAVIESETLDECVEVADDASCLFLGDGHTASATMKPTANIDTGGRLPSLNLQDVTSGSGILGSAGSSASPGITTGVGSGSLRSSNKSPNEESLLINLDEMEKSSQIFAKMDLKSAHSRSPQPSLIDQTIEQHQHHESPPAAQAHLSGQQQQQQQQQPQQQQQEIETESISYLELSMSQLMVRRITETKRRQKF